MADTSDPGQGKGALDMRLWVPAEGGLRGIAGELATKVAEHLGTSAPDAQSLGAAVEKLASDLGQGGSHQGGLITIDFRRVGSELVIEASCNGHASEVRHPLPA
jgi:hypothetical protein